MNKINVKLVILQYYHSTDKTINVKSSKLNWEWNNESFI